MLIYDGHIHSVSEKIDPKQLLEQMSSVGISGGTVISPEPESPLGYGSSYEERMRCLEKWAEGTKGKLFPALWIHPFEKDAVAKVRDAAERGVSAFKIICDCFYVYDEECMTLLREIARLGKPVIFHSGILWDGYDSSKFNRPLNWECLINIPGLRFSLAHCGWPWCDETVALYGKFLHAYSANPSVSAEMYLDLTPGTPAVYRQDLINKLYNCGYDTPRNVLFGTDCTANEYNTGWANGWIERDCKIMEELGVGKRLQELYLGENFLRFIGVTEKDFVHVSPIPDRADSFSLDYANSVL